MQFYGIKVNISIWAFMNCHSVERGFREGNGTPLQYSCLENPMDGGAWWAAVHGVAKSRARLSDFTFTFHFHTLEKETATRSSVLAWRIPGTGEPGGLPSTGSHRVGHDWSNLAAAAAHWSYTLLLLFFKLPMFLPTLETFDFRTYSIPHSLNHLPSSFQVSDLKLNIFSLSKS